MKPDQGEETEVQRIYDLQTMESNVQTSTVTQSCLPPIDCNESHVIVDEAVSVGVPRKLFGRGPVSGPRFTDRRSFGTRSLNVRKTTVLNDAIEARLIHDVPTFPESLPQFTVKTTVEIDFEGNKKRRYSKAVQIDLRN